MLVISMFGSEATKLNVKNTGMLSANLVSTNMLHFVDYFGGVSGKGGVKDKGPYDFSIGEVL